MKNTPNISNASEEISKALEFYRRYKNTYSQDKVVPNPIDKNILEDINERWDKAKDMAQNILPYIPTNNSSYNFANDSINEQNLIRQLDKQQKSVDDNILEEITTSDNLYKQSSEEVNNIITTSLKNTIPNTPSTNTLSKKKKNKDSSNGQQISIETSSGPIILDRHNPAYSQFTVGKDGKVNLNGKKRIILDGKTLQNNHLMENMVLENDKFDYNNIKYPDNESKSEIEYDSHKLSPNVSKEGKDYVNIDIKKQYPYGEPAMQLHGKTKVEGNYDMTCDWENFCTKFGDNIDPEYDYEYEMPVDVRSKKVPININRSQLSAEGKGEKEYNGQFNNGQAIEIGLIKNPHNVVVPTKYNANSQNMPRTVAEWEMQKEMRMENDMGTEDKKYIEEQLPTTNVPPDAIKEAKESGSQTASIALSTKLRDLKTVVTEFARNVNKIDRNLSDEMNLCIYRMLRGAAKIKRRTHHKSTDRKSVV